MWIHRAHASAPHRVLLLACVLALGAGTPAHAQRSQVERIRGPVKPSKQVVLNAPLDGVLKTRPVLEGDFVTAGQVVAQMNDDVQAARVSTARAAFDASADQRSAALAVEEATIVLERTTQAFEKGAATDWELRGAKLRLEQNKAGLDAARERKNLDTERLKLEEETLAQYKVLAPFAGLVVKVEAEPGATMTKFDKLLTIVSLEVLEATLFVPVELFDRLTVGHEYVLAAEAPVNRRLTGRLKVIDPVIDAASRTFRSVFTISNPDRRLPAGFTVELSAPR